MTDYNALFVENKKAEYVARTIGTILARCNETGLNVDFDERGKSLTVWWDEWNGDLIELWFAFCEWRDAQDEGDGYHDDLPGAGDE